MLGGMLDGFRIPKNRSSDLPACFFIKNQARNLRFAVVFHFFISVSLLLYISIIKRIKGRERPESP